MKKLMFFSIFITILSTSFGQMREYIVYENNNGEMFLSFESTNEGKQIGTFFIRDEILNIYGERKVLKAFHGEIIKSDRKFRFEYNKWVTKQSLTSKGNCLVSYTDDEGNHIIDVAKFNHNGKWKISFHNAFIWIVLLISGFLIGIKKKSIHKSLCSSEIREVSLLFYSVIKLCIILLIVCTHLGFFCLVI